MLLLVFRNLEPLRSRSLWSGSEPVSSTQVAMETRSLQSSHWLYRSRLGSRVQTYLRAMVPRQCAIKSASTKPILGSCQSANAHRHAAAQSLPGGPVAPLAGRHRSRIRQGTVNRGRGDGQELLAYLPVQPQVAVTFQRLHQKRKQGLEALPAHAVRGFPQDHKCLGHGLTVQAAAPASSPQPGYVSVENTDGMLAVIPGESDELVREVPLLSHRASLLPLGHRGYQLLPCCRASLRHLASFGSRNCEATMVSR